MQQNQYFPQEGPIWFRKAQKVALSNSQNLESKEIKIKIKTRYNKYALLVIHKDSEKHQFYKKGFETTAGNMIKKLVETSN